LGVVTFLPSTLVHRIFSQTKVVPNFDHKSASWLQQHIDSKQEINKATLAQPALENRHCVENDVKIVSIFLVQTLAEFSKSLPMPW